MSYIPPVDKRQQTNSQHSDVGKKLAQRALVIAAKEEVSMETALMCARLELKGR